MGQHARTICLQRRGAHIGDPKAIGGFEEENNCFSIQADNTLTCEPNKLRTLEEFDENLVS